MAKYKKRKDGLYEVKVSCGYDASGKMKRKTLYAKTITELDKKVFDTKTLLNKGLIVKSSDMIFYDYAKSWFETYKSIKSLNTKAMYKNIIEKHIKNDLGLYHLAKITKSDIQKSINDRQQHYETCKKLLLTLKQIFNSAIDDGLILHNPAKGVSLPPRPNNEKRILTNLEKNAIKKANLSPMQRAFINIIYYTGVRREEALGLTINDFDFKKICLQVNKAVVFDGNNPVVTNTKNETSMRTIPLPPDLIGSIKDYIASLNTLHLFTKQDGSVLTQSAYTKFWKRIVAELNMAIMTPSQLKLYNKAPSEMKEQILPIKGLTAHIFRHNYATMLYYSGMSLKQAASMLGHSDTKMIMDIYSHLDSEKENVSEKMKFIVM